MDPGPPHKGPTQIIYTFHSPQSFLPVHLQPGLVLHSFLAVCLGPACSLQTFILLMNPSPSSSLMLTWYTVVCPVVGEPGSLRQNSGPTSL